MRSIFSEVLSNVNFYSIVNVNVPRALTSEIFVFAPGVGWSEFAREEGLRILSVRARSSRARCRLSFNYFHLLLFIFIYYFYFYFEHAKSSCTCCRLIGIFFLACVQGAHALQVQCVNFFFIYLYVRQFFSIYLHVRPRACVKWEGFIFFFYIYFARAQRRTHAHALTFSALSLACLRALYH
jgi:hypothetical protein